MNDLNQDCFVQQTQRNKAAKLMISEELDRWVHQGIHVLKILTWLVWKPHKQVHRMAHEMIEMDENWNEKSLVWLESGKVKCNQTLRLSLKSESNPIIIWHFYDTSKMSLKSILHHTVISSLFFTMIYNMMLLVALKCNRKCLKTLYVHRMTRPFSSQLPFIRLFEECL